MHYAENYRFVAYVVWNHYRVDFSSRMGIYMMDLEETEFGAEGHSLVVTSWTGYFVWSFYGQEKQPYVSCDGVGLCMYSVSGHLSRDGMLDAAVSVRWFKTRQG